MDSIKSILNNMREYEPKIKRIDVTNWNWDCVVSEWMKLVNLHIDKPQKEKQITEAWKKLCLYYLNSEKSGLDNTKGIYLMGRTGSGKTVTMKIFNSFLQIDNMKYIRDGKLIPFKFMIFNSRDIVNDFSTNGYDGLQKYFVFANICIDDIGSEPENAQYYGTKLDVISEVVEIRYAKGLMTHFTSNLNLDLLAERYNDRIHSRIKHMCNFITLNDKDFRQ